MKVYELAKQLKISSTDALKALQDAGFQYKAIANGIHENDLDMAMQALSNVPKEADKVVVPEVTRIPNDQKKGAMIGIVFDGKHFKMISVKVSDEDVMNRWDYQVISEHTTVHGAIIELFKKLPKVINEFTVKVFKEVK